MTLRILGRNESCCEPTLLGPPKKSTFQVFTFNLCSVFAVVAFQLLVLAPEV